MGIRSTTDSPLLGDLFQLYGHHSAWHFGIHGSSWIIDYPSKSAWRPSQGYPLPASCHPLADSHRGSRLPQSARNNRVLLQFAWAAVGCAGKLLQDHRPAHFQPRRRDSQNHSTNERGNVRRFPSAWPRQLFSEHPLEFLLRTDGYARTDRLVEGNTRSRDTARRIHLAQHPEIGKRVSQVPLKLVHYLLSSVH